MSAPKAWLSLGGAVVAGIGASLCCIGPVVLSLLGLGGAAFATAFEPYRPWSIAVALALLGAGFHVIYRPGSRDRCDRGEPCEVPDHRRKWRILFWIVAGLTVATIAFPYYADLFS